MNLSILRFFPIVVVLAATACSHAPTVYETLRGCSKGRLLVCPVDRPTVADPRTVRASGLCRCTVML